MHFLQFGSLTEYEEAQQILYPCIFCIRIVYLLKRNYLITPMKIYMTTYIAKALCHVLACSSVLIASPCLLNSVFFTAGQDSSACFELSSCVRLDPNLTEISMSNFSNFSVLGNWSLKHMLLRLFHLLRVYRDKGMISNKRSYST